MNTKVRIQALYVTICMPKILNTGHSAAKVMTKKFDIRQYWPLLVKLIEKLRIEIFLRWVTILALYESIINEKRICFSSNTERFEVTHC